MRRRIVIVGGGQAGAQVAISLRELGFDGSLTLLTDEAHLPYQRPPLSKTFLKAPMAVERLLVRPQTYYDAREIDVRQANRAIGIDRTGRVVTTASGHVVPYDALVLATGTRSLWPALAGSELSGLHALRHLADVEQLRAPLLEARRVAIVGGGFIGLEVAAVLRELGRDVVVIEREERVLKRVTSAPVSTYFADLHRNRGVDLRLRTGVVALTGTQGVSAVTLTDGSAVAADAVLLAAGALANDALAAACGLETHDGIVVDAHGRTTDPAIFACGDCARFASRRFGRSLRLESVQNAVDQSRAVAAALLDRPTPYDPVPWFWSDQFEARLQIAGIGSEGDRTEVVGDPRTGSFSVAWSRGGRLQAVDSVNDARAHLAARRRIADETAELGPSRESPDHTGPGRERHGTAI